MVNPRKNSTRIETITNTEADLQDFKKPTRTNSAGTQIATVGSWDGGRSVSSTMWVQALTTPDSSLLTSSDRAYPTTYKAYDGHYSINGILPTKVSGDPTCIKATGGEIQGWPTVFSTFTFPSHPPAPQSHSAPAMTDNLDPRGWTYSAVYDFGGTCDYERDLRPLFPGLGMWYCTQI